MTLTRTQAQAYYDRFGKLQDMQAFYEDAALDDLVEHADFKSAQSVFELGCGTGRFALRLLTKCLPAAASYTGIDLSPTMVKIATERLAPYPERTRIIHSNGDIRFPLDDLSVDRVVSTYVLDLLPETEIHEAIDEAHRVLTSSGKLCLASLSTGFTFGSRIVSSVWQTVFNLRASLVGGCRPVKLVKFIDEQQWSIDHHKVISQFGVPSEILIASRK